MARFLMIEDDADQSMLVKEVIEDHFGAGCVVCAASRAEAIEHDWASFDLIITDYNLPDCLGIKLISEIREKCSTPVIMVTGENSGETAVEAIRKGATDYIVKVSDYMFTIPLVIEKNLTVAKLRQENEKLRNSLENALGEVQQANKQLQSQVERVEQMASTDHMTGLYNRRYFGTVVGQMFADAQRYSHDMAIVMIDLDHYKEINDKYGHATGDQLLVLAGKTINQNLRKADVAARYGGDEFVLILSHTSTADAEAVVQRIRTEFKAASATLIKRDKGVSMSIGIAALSMCQSVTVEELMASADKALYVSKEEGRDRIRVASGSQRLKIANA